MTYSSLMLMVVQATHDMYMVSALNEVYVLDVDGIS